jgi:hypothetical protein
MNAQPIREFRLLPPGSNRGISCDANGAFVGSIPLLKRARVNGREVWEPCDCNQLSKQVGAHYGVPIDMSSKMGGVNAVSRALNEGDIARAQVATVLLAIPEPPPLAKNKPSRSELIKFIRDLHWSDLIKWDADEHPRWPAGSPDSQGGQFAPKGEGAESDTAGRSARIQLADAGMSDASDDPLAEAAARAAAAARRNSGAAHSEVKPVDSEHENFWQTLGPRLSHEARSALSEIGRAEVNESNANLAMGNAEATAITEGLKAYANYRAQPWIGSDGVPIQVPVINTVDPLSDRAALIGHDLFAPNAPLARPATNADWIDPLINLTSVGSVVAGPGLRLVGAGATVAADSSILAADTPFIILPSELPAGFDTTMPIGRYMIPTNAVPKTTTYGNLVSAQIGRLVQNTSPNAAIILRTAPGMKGVDIELQAEGASVTGFQFAEIKPVTDYGFRSFNTQVARWKLPAPVHAFTYDYQGNIYYGFPR